MAGKLYCGINDDRHGGMTAIGHIIKDAWLFGILPETETCKDWSHDRIQVIHDQVQVEWDKYGCLASNLPDDLKLKHSEIYNRAIENARKLGWDPEDAVKDEQ